MLTFLDKSIARSVSSDINYVPVNILYIVCLQNSTTQSEMKAVAMFGQGLAKMSHLLGTETNYH